MKVIVMWLRLRTFIRMIETGRSQDCQNGLFILVLATEILNVLRRATCVFVSRLPNRVNGAAKLEALGHAHF